MSTARNYIGLVAEAVSQIPDAEIQSVVDAVKAACDGGKQIFLIGNGGSAATASHIAEDLQKGLKECTGKKFRAISLVDSTPLICAWANDSGYENVFCEQLDSLAQAGDVVIAISGSGNSPNVIKAIEKANQMGAVTVGWAGFSGGKLAQVAQKSIVVRSDNMQCIEDVHMILGHTLYVCLAEQCAG